MNGFERIIAAVKFQETDRVPVAAPVFGHAAHLSGISMSKYLQDGELLAKAQMHAMDYYGYDMVFALMDVNVETEAVGSVLRYRNHNYPSIEKYAIESVADISSLSLPDPSRDGRMPQLLRAAEIMRQERGDTTMITGCVLGPFNLACQLIGMEKALYLAVDDTDAFIELLDFSTQICIAYGSAQIAAGVHIPMVFDVSASTEIIPAAFFREFEVPRLKKIFSHFKAAGATANWLFITGNIAPILPYFPEMGVDIANFDYCVSPETIKHTLPNTCVNGNIKPLLFEHGEPDEVADASRKLLNTFSSRGGFILTAGCEIPLRAKPENIQAMVDAAIGARGANVMATEGKP